MRTKKFNTLAKAMKYMELVIEGNYGREGLTYNDYSKYDTKLLSKADKEMRGYNWESYIVVRSMGTQYVPFREDEAQAEAKKWNTAEFIFGVTKHYGEACRYWVDAIKLEK